MENIFASSTIYYLLFLFLTTDESSLQLLLVTVIVTIIKALIVMGLGTRLRVIPKVQILGVWQQAVLS